MFTMTIRRHFVQNSNHNTTTSYNNPSDNNQTNDAMIPNHDYTTSSILNYDSNEENDSYTIQVNEMLFVLWTIGSLCHAIYDNTIWYLESCLCCYQCFHSSRRMKYDSTSIRQPHSFQTCGNYIVIFITLSCTMITTFIILIRATMQAQSSSSSFNNDTRMDDSWHNNNETSSSFVVMDEDDQNDSHVIQIQNASQYQFLLSYMIELSIAYWIYYPLLISILFSGVLGGCGRIPILGGRPYEMKKYQQIQQQQQQSSTTTR
jgi:hypothetical protein